ncbi:cytochrome P450 [Trametes sanguinea]|nr:cytochrome P450 [Trametes sanguinea]
MSGFEEAVLYGVDTHHSPISMLRLLGATIMSSGQGSMSSGQDLNFGLFPYGPWWRRHRRAFWQQFHPGTISRYLPGQRRYTYRFLALLLSSPSTLRRNIQFSFQSTIINSVYGIDVVDATDSRLSVAHEAQTANADATPGYFAVELFPFLRFLPMWFPGAGFQQVFARSKVANHRLKHELFNEVKEAWMRGEDRPCVASYLLNRMERDRDSPLDDEEEEIMKNVCAVAIEGSSDTTGNTLQAFFSAMALFPEVQKRAQAELDSVVGPYRLPDHHDSDELTYINAIVKEIVRWHVVFPIGLPHRTVEDDELYDYFIPGGTTIITNVWFVSILLTFWKPSLNRSLCPGESCMIQACTTILMNFVLNGLSPMASSTPPYQILPHSCLASVEGKAALTACHVFELTPNRICPGRYLAIPSLFINIASVLHVFDISLPVDENGQPVRISYECS